jgi:hypothetical protein
MCAMHYPDEAGRLAKKLSENLSEKIFSVCSDSFLRIQPVAS